MTFIKNFRLSLTFCFCLMTIQFLTGCRAEQHPSFTGVVTELYDSSAIVKVNEGEEELQSSDLISVPLSPELTSETGALSIGDEIRIEYDGYLYETYPAQIKVIYQIEKIQS